MVYRIYDPDSEPMLDIVIDDYSVFGCTLDPVAPNSRDWLAKHIEQAFVRAMDRAAKQAVAKHQAELRKLLGI